VKPLRRISALLRELAEAVDDYAAEQEPKPAKAKRRALTEAAEQATKTVRESLRRGGIKVA